MRSCLADTGHDQRGEMRKMTSPGHVCTQVPNRIQFLTPYPRSNNHSALPSQHNFILTLIPKTVALKIKAQFELRTYQNILTYYLPLFRPSPFPPILILENTTRTHPTAKKNKKNQQWVSSTPSTTPSVTQSKAP